MTKQLSECCKAEINSNNEWEHRHECSECGRHIGTTINKEHEGNHTIETTKHKDRRQDVTVNVGLLNVEEETEEGKHALKVINEKVIPGLTKRTVIATIIHTPTGDHSSTHIQMVNVNEWARAAAHTLIKRGQAKSPSEFYVVEHETIKGKAHVRVTTLTS